MIYKFKSKAAGDVIMMEGSGDHVLRIIGKQPAVKGIVEPADMPAAIAAIEAAVAAEEEARRQAQADAAAEGKTPPPGDGVSLRQRAWPLVEMMKRAIAADEEIVWGV
ncbi:DUF1840 domain-containing protein [Piscinibacter sp.]|uniref:DUF1840 domain-containing protein n=1 Tax=Piscinibacter sp. TaxID=1903157 RepID=UPI002C5ED4DA|nr:DUF1840 domain-containing protein [Albitalea sp.]HUG21658.1 DUF1840 domain-containing protein [Albitalea sp.]